MLWPSSSQAITVYHLFYLRLRLQTANVNLDESESNTCFIFRNGREANTVKMNSVALDYSEICAYNFQFSLLVSTIFKRMGTFQYRLLAIIIGLQYHVAVAVPELRPRLRFIFHSLFLALHCFRSPF